MSGFVCSGFVVYLGVVVVFCVVVGLCSRGLLFDWFFGVWVLLSRGFYVVCPCRAVPCRAVRSVFVYA